MPKYEKGGLRKVYKKYKKGGVKKAVKYVGKSIYNRYTKGGIYQVARDVANLKALVNVEKKYIDASYSDSVGQVLGGLTGMLYKDITPIPTLGTGYANRIGQSIKLVSCSMNIILNAQADQRVGQRVRFELWQVARDTKNITAMLNEMYEVNPITTIVDIMSNRNPNNMKDFKKLCSRTVYFPTDQSNNAGAKRQKTLRITLKMDQHVRYAKDTLVLQYGQLYLCIMTNTGNSSPSVVSLLPNIANAAVNTGLEFDMHTRFYYVDN